MGGGKEGFGYDVNSGYNHQYFFFIFLLLQLKFRFVSLYEVHMYPYVAVVWLV